MNWHSARSVAVFVNKIRICVESAQIGRHELQRCRARRFLSLRRSHPEFPQPVVELKGTLIWLWPEVKRWAEATNRS